MTNQLEKIFYMRKELTRTGQILLAYQKMHRPTLRQRILFRFAIAYFKNKHARLTCELTRLERTIDKIDDPLYASILRYKYIDQKSIEQIAELLNYSPRHMHRLYTNAVCEFEGLYEIGA